jgi:hypothetical protein
MELTEITKTNIKFVAIAQAFGITASQIGSRESDLSPRQEQAARDVVREVLKAAGIPAVMAETVLNRDVQWTWTSLYTYIMVEYAIKLAERVSQGNQQCEVGLKCPQFRRYNLFKRYNLSFSGEYVPKAYRTYPEQLKNAYKVYQNPEKTISFSDGGNYWYAGLTFPTLKDAYDFVMWYSTRKSFDSKDIDLFFNGLGGLGLEEIKDFNESCNLVNS